MTDDSGSASDPPKGLRACQPHLRSLVLARNASGIRRLAEQCEVSNEELAAFVRGVRDEELAEGNPDRIGAVFDIHTAQYSTLEEWVASFLKSL